MPVKTFLFKIPKFFSFSHSVCIEHFKILCKTIFHLLKKHTYKKKMIISEFQDIFQNLGQVLDLYSCLHSTSKTKSQLKLIQVDFHVYQISNKKLVSTNHQPLFINSLNDNSCNNILLYKIIHT